MGADSRSRRLSGRHVLLAIAIGAVLVIVALVALAFVRPGITITREVAVNKAELRSPSTLALIVDSCEGDPSLSSLRLTDEDVQVKVRASSTPFQGGKDCLDILEVELEEPLGDRAVVDLHSGETVEVERLNPPSN